MRVGWPFIIWRSIRSELASDTSKTRFQIDQSIKVGVSTNTSARINKSKLIPSNWFSAACVRTLPPLLYVEIEPLHYLLKASTPQREKREKINRAQLFNNCFCIQVVSPPPSPLRGLFFCNITIYLLISLCVFSLFCGHAIIELYFPFLPFGRKNGKARFYDAIAIYSRLTYNIASNWNLSTLTCNYLDK